MFTDGDQTSGAKHTMEYTEDVSLNCILETYIMLLTNVTPINLIKKIKSQRIHKKVIMTNKQIWQSGRI